MNFRLDSSYDHWLLDEFQDTSRLQWQALRDLVDEVIQSDSGRRSFFYVGDTKQAIYSWRGGDPRLLMRSLIITMLLERTGSTPAKLSIFRIARRLKSLTRSTHLLAEQLQRLASILTFPGSSRALALGLATSRAMQIVSWAISLASHRHFPRRKQSVLDEEAARVIREVDPLAKGWSCAVLVRTNNRILSVIEAFVEPDFPPHPRGGFFPAMTATSLRPSSRCCVSSRIPRCFFVRALADDSFGDVRGQGSGYRFAVRASPNSRNWISRTSRD